LPWADFFGGSVVIDYSTMSAYFSGVYNMNPLKVRGGLRLAGLVVATIACSPGIVQAHPGLGQASGFTNGLMHPIGGVDHLIAIVAAGVWAAQLGGRFLWMIPFTFLTMMAAGGSLGMISVPVSLVEQGILMSVVVLGFLIAFAAKLPWAPSLLVIGLFGFVHGYAHGQEMSHTASAWAYGAGFLLSTSVLQAIGLAAAFGVKVSGEHRLLRFSGAITALCGLYLYIQ
jgi:urease accessory protein